MSDETKPAPVQPDFLRQIAEAAFAADLKGAVFETENADEEDVGSYFGRLHGRVSEAFASWENGVLPSHIGFIDMDSGEAAPEEAGYPTGMPIEMADILLDVLAGMRLMKIDPARAVRLALRARQEQDGEEAT